MTFLLCHHHHQFQKIYHVHVPIPRETDWYVCLTCMYSGRDTHLISALQTDTYDQSVRCPQSGYTRIEKCLHRIDAALSCTFDWNMSIEEEAEDRKLSLYTQMTSARSINKSTLASFSCQDHLFFSGGSLNDSNGYRPEQWKKSMQNERKRVRLGAKRLISVRFSLACYQWGLTEKQRRTRQWWWGWRPVHSILLL